MSSCRTFKKGAGFFSAMRHFADELARLGHLVVYLQLDDPKNEHAFDANLIRLTREERIARFEYMQPDDYRLDRQLARLAAELAVPSAVMDSEHFLTSRKQVAQHFQGKKRYLLESFYRQMRRRHDILMDGGKPAGGKWNYDQSIRRRYDGKVPLAKIRGRAGLPLQQLLLGLYPSPSEVACRESPHRDDGPDLGSNAIRQAG